MKKLQLVVGEDTSSTNNTNTEFELPEDISEEDENLLHSVLCALYAIKICCAYKIEVLAPQYFIIRGQISDDAFEVDMDDFHLIKSASPLRIERILVGKSAGQNEIIIKVLNSKQRVMLMDSSMLYVTTRKRKHCKI